MMACSRSACLAMIRRNRSASTGSLHGAVEQGFDEALDRGDRRLELVRDVGHEVAADVFQAAKVGHVVEHDHGADRPAFEIVQRRAAGLHHPLAIAVQQDVGLDRFAAGQRAGDEAAQVGIAHDLLQPAALGLGLVEAQQPAEAVFTLMTRSWLSTASTPSAMLASTAFCSLLFCIEHADPRLQASRPCD